MEQNKYVIALCFFATLMIVIIEFSYRDFYKYGWGQVITDFSLAVVIFGLISLQYYKNEVMNPANCIILVILLSIYVQLFIVTQNNYKNKCEDNDDLGILTKAFIYNDSLTAKGNGRIIYSLFYVILLIIVLLTILNLYDKKDNTLEKLLKPEFLFKALNIDRNNYPYIIYSFPLILPIITEIITYFYNLFDGGEGIVSNESIFINFILGTDEEDFKLLYDWGHILFSSFFVLFFVFYIGSHSGLVPNYYKTPLTETGLGLILLLLILFPIIMRTIFLQRCTTDKIKEDNKTDLDLNCVLSKYGGVLLLVIISLMVMFLHRVKVTETKFMYFIIIIFGGLSGGFMLDAIKIRNNEGESIIDESIQG